MRQLSLPALAAAALLFAAPAAFATPTTESADLFASWYPSAAAGTVTLTQNGLNEVDLQVTLMPVNGSPTYWANTGGPHAPFAFNLSSAVTDALVTITSPASVFFVGTGAHESTPYGSFTNWIYCTKASCGSGASGKHSDTLDLKITSATGIGLADFVANSDDGVYFAADLLVNGATGSVPSNTPSGGGGGGSGGTPAPLPEPASLALLGVALAGLAFVRRRGATA